MGASFETLETRTVGMGRGRDLRVSVVAVSDRETHYQISLREWITESSAERYGVTVGNGRKASGKTRSTYTGPDKFHGTHNLSPREAFEVAEALAALALEAMSLEERDESEGAA